VIVWSEADLSRHLRRFGDHYHRSRTQLGLEKDTDSVGINRRGAVMEDIIQVRNSDPTWPQAMRGQPVRLHSKRWTGAVSRRRE
jgi:hypothetical protein